MDGDALRVFKDVNVQFCVSFVDTREAKVVTADGQTLTSLGVGTVELKIDNW